jgi:transposase
MSKRSQYVGLDVSLKETAIAVIDDAGKIVWRGTVASTPETIAEALRKHAPRAVRIGLEAGQLASWLYHGLTEKGLPVICVEARHARAALSLKVNKTDANDALGLAQIMRVGWYRKVEVKGHGCQALRALLVARAQLVSQVTTLRNCVRGILKVFGHILPKKLRAGFIDQVREAITGDATLAATVEPMLCTLAATMEQLNIYDRAVLRHAREDETVRHLMSAPGVGAIVAMGYMTCIETPDRFTSSSAVGAYLGMTPRRYQSGEVDLAGRVSRRGDSMVRGLLFEAAKVVLSRSARPSDLQAWGRSLARRIGSKKATMAVARKLAVILHRMWATGEPFRWMASPVVAAAR